MRSTKYTASEVLVFCCVVLLQCVCVCVLFLFRWGKNRTQSHEKTISFGTFSARVMAIKVPFLWFIRWPDMVRLGKMHKMQIDDARPIMYKIVIVRWISNSLSVGRFTRLETPHCSHTVALHWSLGILIWTMRANDFKFEKKAFTLMHQSVDAVSVLFIL